MCAGLPLSPWFCSDRTPLLQEATCTVARVATRRRLRSASTANLVVQATRRCTFGDCAFAVTGPRLPADVHCSVELCSFKRALKTHLFKLSFSLIDIFDICCNLHFSDYVYWHQRSWSSSCCLRFILNAWLSASYNFFVLLLLSSSSSSSSSSTRLLLPILHDTCWLGPKSHVPQFIDSNPGGAKK